MAKGKKRKKKGLQPRLTPREEELAERFGLLLSPEEEIWWIKSFLKECRIDQIPGTDLHIGNICAADKARQDGMRVIDLSDWPEGFWGPKRVRKLVRRVDRLLDEGEVFMHCMAGVDRCPTAATAYLVSKCQEPLEAVDKVLRARPEADPHVSWILDYLFDELDRKERLGCPTR